MKIKKIRLRNFKRFTDLSIQDIPDTARLVLVVGPNGCGKSSLFDALIHWYRSKVGFGINDDVSYFRKNIDLPFQWHESVEIVLSDESVPTKGCLYVRSAYRNDPDFSVGGINRMTSPIDNLRLLRAIDNDQAVSENYQRLVYDTMAGVYSEENNGKTVPELREDLIGQVKASMQAVFGDLVLNNISDPLSSGAFYFKKGEVQSYHYKNLSGGEKAAFDLLLDLHMKKKFFKDAIYCIDEIETHLHTKVQGALLREMIKIIPPNSQLWVTTHSLGVLRAAQEISNNEKGSVAIVDFDDVNQDESRVIVPSTLGRISWEKLLSIAIDDLSQRISPKIIYICEGSSIGGRRKDFDAEIFNRIFEGSTTDILFVSGGSESQLKASGFSIEQVLKNIYPLSRVVLICDRDDKTSSEVEAFERNGGFVLSERNLESYLLADDVLEELLKKNNQIEFLKQVKEIKTSAINSSVLRGNQPDDFKSAAGEIYNDLKKLLNLQQCGSNADAFMKDILVPLIKDHMQTYHKLKADILDKVRLS